MRSILEMRRNVAPYGAGSSSFNAGATAVPFATPAPPGTLSLPFNITNGPGVPYRTPEFPFPVDGMYTSQNKMGWPTNNTVPHHLIVRSSTDDRDSIDNIRALGEGMFCFVRNPDGGPKCACPDLPVPPPLVPQRTGTSSHRASPKRAPGTGGGAGSRIQKTATRPRSSK